MGMSAPQHSITQQMEGAAKTKQHAFILEFANALSSTRSLPYSFLIIYGVPDSCCFPLWALVVH
jgi:hypothetical protein